MGVTAENKKIFRNIVKAVSITYLTFNESATAKEITDFIDVNGLLFSKYGLDIMFVSNVLRSSKMGENNMVFKKTSVVGSADLWSLNNE